MASTSSKDDILLERDEVTSKFLHKLYLRAKQNGFPSSILAHYEIQAWNALKSSEKLACCKKCSCPPPLELSSTEKSEISSICRNCGSLNKSDIRIVNTKRFISTPKNSVNPMNLGNEIPKVKKIMKTPTVANRKTQNTRNELLNITPHSTPPLLLQSSKKNKKAKKAIKVVDEVEPDFLKKLFGIGSC